MVPSSFYNCNSHLLIWENFKSRGARIGGGGWWNPFILGSTENVNDLGYQHLKSLPHEFQMMWTAKDVNGFDSIICCVLKKAKNTLRNKSQAQLISGPAYMLVIDRNIHIIPNFHPRLHEECQVSNPSTWRCQKPHTEREEGRTQTLAKEPRIHRSTLR